MNSVNNLEHKPLQGVQTTVAHLYMCALDGSGIETYDDLTNSGAQVWPYEPGFTSFNMARDWMREAEIWGDIDEIVNVSTSNIVGAIQEGRVDAFMPTAVSYRSLVGWAQELETLDVDFHVLEMEPSHIEAINSVGLPHTEIESYGWNTKDFGTIDTWGLTGAFWFTPDVPNRVAYQVTKMFHDQSKAMQQAAPIILPYSNNQEYMVTNLLPQDRAGVHPGAKQYYREEGLWPLPADQSTSQSTS